MPSPSGGRERKMGPGTRVSSDLRRLKSTTHGQTGTGACAVYRPAVTCLSHPYTLSATGPVLSNWVRPHCKHDPRPGSVRTSVSLCVAGENVRTDTKSDYHVSVPRALRCSAMPDRPFGHPSGHASTQPAPAPSLFVCALRLLLFLLVTRREPRAAVLKGPAPVLGDGGPRRRLDQVV